LKVELFVKVIAFVYSVEVAVGTVPSRVYRMVVPAGEEVTATIDNRDSGIGHNLSVALPGGEAKTDVEPGPAEQTLRFTVPEPGEYDFVCDPHAATMKGVVEAV